MYNIYIELNRGVHLMDNTQQREEGFSKMENLELQARVRELEYDCGELAKSNSELSDRVRKLATRQPMWPKGYRPQNRKYNNK